MNTSTMLVAELYSEPHTISPIVFTRYSYAGVAQ